MSHSPHPTAQIYIYIYLQVRPENTLKSERGSTLSAHRLNPRLYLEFCPDLTVFLTQMVTVSMFLGHIEFYVPIDEANLICCR